MSIVLTPICYTDCTSRAVGAAQFNTVNQLAK
jgi:hypothetical protein